MAPKQRIQDYFRAAPKPQSSQSSPASQQPTSQDAGATVAHRQAPQPAFKQSALDFSRFSSAAKPSYPRPDALVSDHTRTPSATEPPRPPSPNAQPPTTSQSSGNSAPSKRVRSNGQEVVLNSDTDSDDDDTASLPDLRTSVQFLNKDNKKETQTKPPLSIQKVESDGLRRPPKLVQRDRASFRNLLHTTQQNAEKELNILQDMAELTKSDHESSDDEFEVNEETLKEFVRDDEDSDRAQRVYRAMQRTNALEMKCEFHFFEDVEASLAVPLRFPINSLPQHQWITTNFRDIASRDDAFLSGFAESVFRYLQLPKELASWLIDQICFTQKECLNSRYIQLIASHPQYIRALLDKPKLQQIFKEMGAKMDWLDEGRRITPQFVPTSSTKSATPTSLKSFAQLVSTVSPHLSSDSTAYILYFLFHVCMDHRVLSDADSLRVVQDAIEALIIYANDKELKSLLDTVVPLLLSRIKHPILQKELVSSFPSKTPMTAYLQRQLALSFLAYPHPIDVSLSDEKVVKLLHWILSNSPAFRINREISYTSLAANLTLLDTAIGPGPLEVPYQPLTSPSSSRGDQWPTLAPGPKSKEKQKFNDEVDALATHVKQVGNLIVEAGAIVDLTRLDAKDCCERLHHRLDHAVRIGGPKKESIFGDTNANKHGDSNVLKEYVKKVTVEKAKEGEQAGDFSDEIVRENAIES